MYACAFLIVESLRRWNNVREDEKEEDAQAGGWKVRSAGMQETREDLKKRPGSSDREIQERGVCLAGGSACNLGREVEVDKGG